MLFILREMACCVLAYGDEMTSFELAINNYFKNKRQAAY